MEATFSFSSRLRAYPVHLFTSINHQPTVISRPHNNIISFHHQPSSLCPSGHLRVMCRPKFRRVAHALNALRRDGDDGNNKAGVVVGASVVLACVLGAMCLTRPRVLALGAPFQGPPGVTSGTTKLLEALCDTDRAREAVSVAKMMFADGLKANRIEFVELQDAARILELSEEIDNAVETLSKKYECMNGGEEAYELGLILVEMHIYQGQLDNAKAVLKKVKDQRGGRPSDARPEIYKGQLDQAKAVPEDVRGVVPSDARPEIYEAVISLMHHMDAYKSSNKYKKKDVSEASNDPSITPISFDVFMSKMMVLKEKIDEKRRQ